MDLKRFFAKRAQYRNIEERLEERLARADNARARATTIEDLEQSYENSLAAYDGMSTLERTDYGLWPFRCLLKKIALP